MTVTNHPLHRSGRALLTHPAPALGNDAKPSQGIRVMKHRRWQPTVNQTAHSFPSQGGFLAATPQGAVPVTSDVEAKARQSPKVSGNTKITIVSRHHRPQPLAYFQHRLVHPQAQFRFDLL